MDRAAQRGRPVALQQTDPHTKAGSAGGDATATTRARSNQSSVGRPRDGARRGCACAGNAPRITQRSVRPRMVVETQPLRDGGDRVTGRFCATPPGPRSAEDDSLTPEYITPRTPKTMARRTTQPTQSRSSPFPREATPIAAAPAAPTGSRELSGSHADPRKRGTSGIGTRGTAVGTRNPRMASAIVSWPAAA